VSTEEKRELLKKLYFKTDIETKIGQKPPYSESERFVTGEGSVDAKIMFIGEAPGQKESEQGRPFVGRSGMLLRTLLKELEFNPADCFITNIVKWRPPQNRTPTPQEIIYCYHTYLKEEIDIIKPLIICTLGASSLKSICPMAPNITTARGKQIVYENCILLPTIHPAYALYNPAEKETLRKDLKTVKELAQDLQNIAKST